MIAAKQKEEFYQAFVSKNADYEGVFFVGVMSTGIFCRPTCPARKPKLENCTFFACAQDALRASYRPCKRCNPLELPESMSRLVQALMEAVENDPTKRWSVRDLEKHGADASTVRRQFKKRFGMTFAAYARARRMDIASQQMHEGERVIEAQLNAGYDSASGFREAFAKTMGAPPTQAKAQLAVLKASWIDTPLGPMMAVADETGLFLLSFANSTLLERQIEYLRSQNSAVVLPGTNAVLEKVEAELTAYFAGTLHVFETPLHLGGTPFQVRAWEALMAIPYGQARSYKEQAACIQEGSATRAVAAANAANLLAIVIPCHRVINSSGETGGYAGGVVREKWLLAHETRHA
ncbi:MAG: bifunctional transcriptional activator/DNA repair enzyme protein Ada [Candidatus Puniceispirillum sp.]|nr:bifunctional transcriptional activator/DNA repair enzyme protein Ada [Candidatus Puniceispirillum sp.]